MKKERNIELDILKGLSIILVVLGHTRFAGTQYIYLFHMAVFFMASGFFFKPNNSDTLAHVGIFIKKRILGLWLPFVIWNTVFTLLSNVFIKINIYTDNPLLKNYVDSSLVSVHSKLSLKEMAVNIAKGLFMAGHTELGGAFWFLRVLFYISVGYVIVDFVLKKMLKSSFAVIIVQGILSALLLAFGYYLSIKGIKTFSIDICCSCYCLYYLGFILGKIKINNFKTIFNFPECIICAVLLYILSQYGTISLGDNNYVNPAFMLSASVLGWYMLLSLSRIISKIAFMNKLFAILGQYSIYIVIFHFLAFKSVNLIIASTKSFPAFTVAAFPVLTTQGAWWILYTIIGLSLPLILGVIWQKSKSLLFCKNHISR